NLRYDGVISGDGSVVKLGAGTLTLTGDQTYQGATTISEGSLMLRGSLGNTAVTVKANATLGGEGAIAGGVTLNNHATLLGSAGSMFHLGSLALSGTSNLNVALGAPSTTALFDISGGLTLNGLLNVTDAGGFNY